jgi:hypothetical protein
MALTFNGLHGVISQKTELFVTAAVRNQILHLNFLIAYRTSFRLHAIQRRQSSCRYRKATVHATSAVDMGKLRDGSHTHIYCVSFSSGQKAAVCFMLVSCLAYSPSLKIEWRMIFNGLHTLISQKIGPFITNAVGTSNATWSSILLYYI